jgi:prophage regulatory protein
MRFRQSYIDNLVVHFPGYERTKFDDDLPGFGVYRDKDGNAIYVVEYVKAGVLVRKKIGKTHKISLKKARKAANKILGKLPVTDRHEPAPIKRPIHRTKPIHREPEKITVKPGRSIFTDGKGPRRLLRYPDLMATRGITYTRQHLYRLEAAGKFPKRVKLGDRAIAWVESEIDEYLEKIIAGRS